MKSTRTKIQELVAEFYGTGKYLVGEADLPKLVQFFENRFSTVLSSQYLIAMMKFLRGERLTPYERQQKFYAMESIRSAMDTSEEPEFLDKVDYPDDRVWALSDLAEALFGAHGDTRIYRAELPEPANGVSYTTSEVKEVVAHWNTQNGSD